MAPLTDIFFFVKLNMKGKKSINRIILTSEKYLNLTHFLYLDMCKLKYGVQEYNVQFKKIRKHHRQNNRKIIFLNFEII